MPFPSTFSTFTRPATTDRLNNPSHSTLENNQSSTIGQIEVVIGRSGDNSVLGTIIGDLRSPNSKGGGHVQGVAFGGTGQTTFTKGDLLVAASASVLAKLAGGGDGQVLIASTAAATGMAWGQIPGNRIATNTSIFALSVASTTGVGPSSVMSASVLGSTLGTSGVVRSTLFISNLRLTSKASIQVNAIYGNTVVASVVLAPGASATSIVGKIQFDLMANGATNAQVGYLTTNIFRQIPSVETNAFNLQTFIRGTSTEDSAAPKVIGFTARAGLGGQAEDDFIVPNGYIVEKIV